MQVSLSGIAILKRVHISDSCESFKKSWNFEYLKMGLKTMPISMQHSWILKNGLKKDGHF